MKGRVESVSVLNDCRDGTRRREHESCRAGPVIMTDGNNVDEPDVWAEEDVMVGLVSGDGGGRV